MKIGLLSDTHVPDTGRSLPPAVLRALRGVDLILHAGDIYLSSVLDELEQIAPVLAARGDDDWLQDPRVRDFHILELEGITLGLVHSFYGFYFLENMEAEMERRFGRSVDIVVFGHTHVSEKKWHKGRLLISPGSPTLPNYSHRLGSIGLLQIQGKQIQADIIPLT